MNIRAQRLHVQHLAKPALSPVEVVAAFGAMQAQEYALAKWAIGLRAPGTTDADIERAIAAGAILRTHPLRMTHHFVTPADIRWLLALLGPVAIKRAAKRWHDLGLDDKTVGKSHEVLSRALEGGKHLMRGELAAVLRRAGISPQGQRLPHLLARAELAALICSGARNGNQITFALLDERVPSAKPLVRDAALAELARRYFTTRGPATMRDFMWWAGLPAADAKAALAGANQYLARDTIDGVLHGRSPGATTPRVPTLAYLLPTYDEYMVAYRDRTAIGKPPAKPRNFGEATLLGPSIVVGGEVVGSWSRTFSRGKVAIALRPWRKLTEKQRALVDAAANRYADFVGSSRQ